MRLDREGVSIDLGWLVAHCGIRTVKGINDTISAMIRKGELVAGARFPTIRALADGLSVSPNTIALAWKGLRQDGMIYTSRRGGTFVSQPFEHKTQRISSSIDWTDIDLASGSPDPKLQPQLEEALLSGLRVRSLHSERRDHIIEPLAAAVAETWPFACEKWTTAAGGTEGNLLAVLAAAQPKGLVAVEQPTSPGLVRTLKTLGLTAIGTPWDSEGPMIASLEEALMRTPAAFIYQPRSHTPLGLTVSAARMAEMAALFERYPQTWIVEDDGLGPLSNSPPISLGRFLPNRTLLVRTYCKAFGADLKVCILGGAAELIDRVREHRSYGTTVTSRILQGAVAHLLIKPKFRQFMDRARLQYARRRQMTAQSLRRRGFDLPDGDGVVLWLPVNDEGGAISRLASRGVVLAPGSLCYIDRPAKAHLRLATSRMPEHQRSVDELADLILASVGEDVE